MRVVAICQPASDRERQLVFAQHQLRARVFSERLHWEVALRSGVETDEFDQLDPTYILALLENGEVVGCARLLPASGPTMLRRTFPMLLPPGGFHPSAATAESSRFCVDTKAAKLASAGLIHEATLTMFAAISEWCLLHGYAQIVTVTDLRIERILSLVGWPLQRLSSPCQVGATKAVAGLLPVDRQIFLKLRPDAHQSHFAALGAAA